MEKMIGKKIDGRYQVQELVGIGGMANVYKAVDLLENRYVAVKALREEYIGNEEFMRRFRNESKAVALLSHPNIVRVYDVSLSDRQPCIVMEYIDGITLKDYIQQQGRIRWKEAVHFTVQTLRALQHAHDNGIVHRDIKPQNIMLLSDGTIKITDFGIARFARATSHTITDKAIGSVHYISPEQAQGAETDAKTDIYSVGVILYEMLTGKVPFEADSPVSVAIKQIESQAVAPSALNPDIPAGLEEITLRAMQKDPTARYQSAAEMLRDIDRFKRDPSISFAYKYMTAEDEHAAYTQAAAPSRTGRAAQGAAGQSRRPARQQSQGRAAHQPASHAAASAVAYRKGTPILPVLAGITLAFVIATIVFVVTMFNIHNPFADVEEVDLPQLVGLEYNSIIKDKNITDNFEIVLEVTEPKEGYANGIIFEQSPSSVPSLKKGSTIKVKVSSGAQMITLPPLAGQEATSVFAKLKSYDLEYEEVTIDHDTIQEGYVVRTDPDKNTQVPTGTVVTVYVSRGTDKEMLEVPNVGHDQEEDAVELIEEAGFKAVVTYQQSDRYDEGEVIRQSPEGGNLLEEGGEVQLVVSSGDREGSNSLDVLVKLPTNITDEVEMVAELDGDIVKETTLVPADRRVWRVSFEGDGWCDASIYLDGVLLAEYELDFDDNTVDQTEDNLDEFEDW